MPGNRLVVFLTIAVVGCAADLAAKSYVFAWLGMPPSPTQWLWTDVVGFQASLNEGALFGLGQGWAIVFACLAVPAALAIVYWLFFAGGARDWKLTIALAMVTAGLLGNLYDRLGLHGLRWPLGAPREGEIAYAVRDYILVMIGRYQWPNFNIADSLLVCGAALLVWHASRDKPVPAAQSAPTK